MTRTRLDPRVLGRGLRPARGQLTVGGDRLIAWALTVAAVHRHWRRCGFSTKNRVFPTGRSARPPLSCWVQAAPGLAPRVNVQRPCFLKLCRRNTCSSCHHRLASHMMA